MTDEEKKEVLNLLDKCIPAWEEQRDKGLVSQETLDGVISEVRRFIEMNSD